MTIYKLLFAAGIAASLLGVEAHAADITMPTTVRPQPYFGEPQSFPRWSGWYAGAGVGADWLRSDDGIFTDRSRAQPFGQVFAGYDWQFVTLGQAFVVGALADVNYSGARAPVSPGITYNSGITGDARQRWSGDAGMRLGWAPIAPVLFYVNGGGSLNWSHERLSDPLHGLSVSASKQPGFGWFTGVGAEGYIQRNITLRAEYRFGQSDFGNSAPRGIPAPWRTLNDQRAMLGIAWRQ